MRRFDIVTEADARVLPTGETILLSRGGHVTPLALDTLRERRVTIVREDVLAPEEAALLPPTEMRRLALGSDHTGVALRRSLLGWLRGQGLTVVDCGADGIAPVDYPDIAAVVAEAVAAREVDGGVVIDGAGIGSAIAANKVPGVRAAMATSVTIARYAREHNGANVLTLGATFVSEPEAREILTAWLSAAMREPRYVRRLAKIRALEVRARGNGSRHET